MSNIATNLSELLAIRENIGQNFLLQKVETGVDIDATIVSNRIVTERYRLIVRAEAKKTKQTQNTNIIRRPTSINKDFAHEIASTRWANHSKEIAIIRCVTWGLCRANTQRNR